MNSKKKEREKQHRKATKEAAMLECVSCGRVPCSPCHYPTHRGMGSGKAGWERLEWEPLCPHCHDVLDRRLGVSKAVEYERALLIKRIERVRQGRNPDPTEL